MTDRASIAAQVERGDEQPRFGRALGVAGAMTALFAAWLWWGLGGETATRYFDDLATLLAALAAAGLCARAGIRHEGRLRLFWWLLAGACGAWALGELIWTLYDLVLLGEVPVPSWADAAYLAGTPLAAAALISHPALRGSGNGKARSALDGVVIATALLFLSWALVLGPLWHASDLTTLGGLVTVAYPFTDAVVVFLIVLVIHGMTSGGRTDLWCLLAGLLAITLSDTAYGYLTQVADYATGT
jgi:two-component system, sensor histidine kinase and response regulator